MASEPVRMIGAEQQPVTATPGRQWHQRADAGTLPVQSAILEQALVQDREDLAKQHRIGTGWAGQILQLAPVLGPGQPQPRKQGRQASLVQGRRLATMHGKEQARQP